MFCCLSFVGFSFTLDDQLSLKLAFSFLTCLPRVLHLGSIFARHDIIPVYHACVNVISLTDNEFWQHHNWMLLILIGAQNYVTSPFSSFEPVSKIKTKQKHTGRSCEKAQTVQTLSEKEEADLEHMFSEHVRYSIVNIKNCLWSARDFLLLNYEISLRPTNPHLSPVDECWFNKIKVIPVHWKTFKNKLSE